MDDNQTLAKTTLRGSIAKTLNVTVKGVWITVIWHPDLQRVGATLGASHLLEGQKVQLSRAQPIFEPLDPQQPSLPLGDPYLSRKPIEITLKGNERVVFQPSASGTGLKVNGQSVHQELELPLATLGEGVVLELANRITLLIYRSFEPSRTSDPMGMLGMNHALGVVRQSILQVADLDISVLVRGESGTGKELVARALHNRSARRGKKLIAVNMAAIPHSVASSELFGHLKGGFTGASHDRAGYFMQAHQGTLFLDEIGDMASDVQVMLLRALETGEIRPVGSTAPQSVDIRFIAATDRNLESAIESGEFRQPLLQRVSGFQIALPPLRERKEDIGILFLSFIRQELTRINEMERLTYRDGHEPWIPSSYVAALCRCDWPGNVRELANMARQVVVLNRGRSDFFPVDIPTNPVIGVTPTEVSAAKAVAANPPRAVWGEEPTGKRRTPSDIGEDELIEALRANKWQTGKTSKALVISKTSLYKMMDACSRIRTPKSLTRGEIEEAMAKVGSDLDGLAGLLEVSPRGLMMRMKELGLVTE
ncbi:MAG: sigma 54-interacting transcriptional regulator [Myxococcota bacterium]|nr:sigma 54-interacting transcriptional regulator [Myxococcota bacterium]